MGEYVTNVMRAFDDTIVIYKENFDNIKRPEERKMIEGIAQANYVFVEKMLNKLKWSELLALWKDKNFNYELW